MRVPNVFNATQREVLAALEQRDRQERSAEDRGALSLKAVAPEVGELLYLLVVQKRATTLVEFGTSHGYSTLYLAAAAAQTGGHVHSVDAMPEKTALATANLEAAGLIERVTLTTSDGSDFAATLPAAVDFVLVDYPIPAFMPAFPSLRERTAPGCFLFVDGGPDGYWEQDAVRPFRTLLDEDPAFVTSILPMNKEQLIAVRV